MEKGSRSFLLRTQVKAGRSSPRRCCRRLSASRSVFECSAQTTVTPGRSEDMRIAFGGFSIATLEPGDYQMRAVVSLDGKPVGKVVRTLRKSK